MEELDKCVLYIRTNNPDCRFGLFKELLEGYGTVVDFPMGGIPMFVSIPNNIVKLFSHEVWGQANKLCLFEAGNRKEIGVE